MELKFRPRTRFTEFGQVDEWVRSKEPGGVEKLRKLVASGHVDGRSERLANAWLEQEVRREQSITQTRSDAFAARQTRAAEISAAAAKQSARFAGLALFVAIAALLVAAWQYMPWSN